MTAILSSTSSSALQRDLASLVILRGRVNLRLNFRLKGYVSRQYLWIVRQGNGYTTTLLLEVLRKETL